MAASNYAPPAGNIQVTDGYQTVKKYNLSKNQRAFPHGTPLWLNKVSGRYQVEPALLSPTNATQDSNSGNSDASTYTTLELANAAFAPLFAGFAASARVSQQLAPNANFNVPGPATTTTPDDASQPFQAVHDEGIAIAPLGATLGPALATAIEVGVLVNLDGFVNEEASGFYDPAGALQVGDVAYYMYNNAVKTTTTAANAIGVVCERAEVGQTYLKFKFKSAVLNPASVL